MNKVVITCNIPMVYHDFETFTMFYLVSWGLGGSKYHGYGHNSDLATKSGDMIGDFGISWDLMEFEPTPN